MKNALKIFVFVLSTVGFTLGYVEQIDFSKWALNIQASPQEFEFPGIVGDKPTSPVPPTPTAVKPEVLSFHVHSDIRYRYCRTNVISKVTNPNSGLSSEVTFQVVLPDSAFISKFSMEIDGKSYQAYVKEKEAAKKVYSTAKEQGQNAGLVEINARDSNVFNVNVNVKANSNITFDLTYEELLARKLGQYEHAINVNSEEISQIKDYKITVSIQESQNISALRVPNLRNDLELLQDDEGNNADVKIERPTGSSANISWSPTERDQIRLIEQGVRGKFVVQYEIHRESDAGEILLMNGYFVHFFAPKDVLPLRKHVVFVLDISGSMHGRKIEQLKSSMLFVLDDLKPDDYFNILTFSSGVNLWSPGKQRGVPRAQRRFPLLASERNVRKAHNFINRLYPDGGTNINAALIEALTLCESVKPIQDLNVNVRAVRSTSSLSNEEDESGQVQKLPSNVESTIIFLTDGEPTVGYTNPETIMTNVKEANSNLSVPIYSLAFGDSADFEFIKKLALQNKGFGRKIYEASDSDLQMKGFYKEISSPLLSNISFQYTSENFTVSQLTTKKFPKIFGGGEIAIAGKFKPKNITVNNTIPTPIDASEENEIETSSSTTPGSTNFVIPIIVVDVGANGRDGRVSYNEYDVVENDISTTFLFHHPTVTPIIPVPEKKEESLTITKPVEPRTNEDLFLERLWAYLTIRQLIDKSVAQEKAEYVEEDEDDWDDSEEDSDENEIEGKLPKMPSPKPDEGPKQRALKIALKYGFVTPLTSLVVVKPNDTDNTRNANIEDDGTNLTPVAVPGGSSPPRHKSSFSHTPLSASHFQVPTFKSYALDRQPRVLQGPPSPRMGMAKIQNVMDIQRSNWRAEPASLPSLHYDYDASRSGILSSPIPIPQSRYQGASLGREIMMERMYISPTTEAYRSSISQNQNRISHSDAITSKHEHGTSKQLLKLAWFHRGMGFVVVNQTRYKIDAKDKRVDPIRVYPCNNTFDNISSEVGQGNCVHLKDCVRDEIANNMNLYLGQYFCPLMGNSGRKYAGICCTEQG